MILAAHACVTFEERGQPEAGSELQHDKTTHVVAAALRPGGSSPRKTSVHIL